MEKKKPYRSGTPWTEEMYEDAGWVRRSIRLRPEESDALIELVEAAKKPLARVIGDLALAEVARRRRVEEREERGKKG